MTNEGKKYEAEVITYTLFMMINGEFSFEIQNPNDFSILKDGSYFSVYEIKSSNDKVSITDIRAGITQCLEFMHQNNYHGPIFVYCNNALEKHLGPVKSDQKDKVIALSKSRKYYKDTIIPEADWDTFVEDNYSKVIILTGNETNELTINKISTATSRVMQQYRIPEGVSSSVWSSFVHWIESNSKKHSEFIDNNLFGNVVYQKSSDKKIFKKQNIELLKDISNELGIKLRNIIKIFMNGEKLYFEDLQLINYPNITDLKDAILFSEDDESANKLISAYIKRRIHV